jgi:SNF2 family DNA or RNA helicase
MREIEDNWNAGRVPVLLAQPQSVAHGLNLQEVGAAVIFHSLIWDLELTEQLIRRVWRQGQKSRVVVHYIMAADTIDYVIASVVGQKDKLQRGLMASLKAYCHDTDTEGRRENRYGKEDDNALLIEEE